MHEEEQTMALLSRIRTAPVDQSIIDEAGRLFRKWNPSHGIDPIDAILAATALTKGGQIHTLNLNRYPMKGVAVVKAWSVGSQWGQSQWGQSSHLNIHRWFSGKYRTWTDGQTLVSHRARPEWRSGIQSRGRLGGHARQRAGEGQAGEDGWEFHRNFSVSVSSAP
jgi:PIN domain